MTLKEFDPSAPASFRVVTQQSSTGASFDVTVSRLILTCYRRNVYIYVSGARWNIHRLPTPLSDQIYAFVAETGYEDGDREVARLHPAKLEVEIPRRGKVCCS